MVTTRQFLGIMLIWLEPYNFLFTSHRSYHLSSWARSMINLSIIKLWRLVNSKTKIKTSSIWLKNRNCWISQKIKWLWFSKIEKISFNRPSLYFSSNSILKRFSPTLKTYQYQVSLTRSKSQAWNFQFTTKAEEETVKPSFTGSSVLNKWILLYQSIWAD